jgi:hypothetical protein
LPAGAQTATVKARVDATKITVGDQVKLFIEASNNAKQGRLQWAVIPDTFNSLEVVEKGKIDTVQHGDIVTYKQRLLVTGFDSGSFRIPAFTFPVIPTSGTPYTLATDSFQLLVQTVPVDTSKGYKGIKEIMTVKSTWRDYIWLIAGGALLILLLTIVVIYFLKHKKTQIPTPVPKKPVERPQERAMRLLNELEQQQLWQTNRIKEYYVQLTDILRSYIEERFHTPAMELTTDELLQKAKMHPELRAYYDQLANILYTSDLAKFAKAQPLPHEHTSTMELTKQLIIQTKPLATTQQPS